ncbi:MAG: transglycosylase domain-containing protein [Clostridia bacterium]|uniref:transglycosylase domain-containing protein n=1 Tax=Mogibacterium kristiansenii TaxID=2606708 RepID=UPI0024097A5D|nr:transglycosylase domain-containing protein [Mogibacterium kristiansenii]MDD6700835.1 transglycosylase domain-containing protein [Mogibacterium kristiansenii]MDY5450782.1 transglycosylase domain-containing protein [Clostridia bacterium]
MQKDNDQRTDKDLEVEEYLSQFGADEEVQDDTDISSFLIDDPEESLNAESTPSETELEPELVDEEPETDAPPSEADDFDFESIDSRNSDETDLNLEDLNDDIASDADLESSDAAAGAAYANSLISSESETAAADAEEPIEDGASECPDSDAEEDVSKESEENATEDVTPLEVIDDTDTEPDDTGLPLSDDDVIEADDTAETETEVPPTEEPAESEENADENPHDEGNSHDAEETEPDEVSSEDLIRSKEISAVSDVLLEDDAADVKEIKEPKLTRQEKKAARQKKGKRAARFLSLFVENPDYDSSQGETIVKEGKHIKNKPKKFSFFHLFRDIILAGVLCVMIFICYSFVIITKAPKIDPVNIYDNIQQSSVIYNDEGRAVDSAYYTQDRKICKYEDMPENLVNAFVALEDKTFWKHHGFNWTRMIGAVFQSITGSGKISGTSTITQQLARNVYLPETMSTRSIKRKVLEMYYAAVIERKLSKKEIVEAYLNTIYLGFGNYGVEAASESYFGKKPKDLSLVQCASLAALPQAPDSYALVQMLGSGETPDDNDTIIKKRPNKYVANDESKNRRETCLALMKDQGYITEDQYNKAKGQKLTKFLNAQLSNKASKYSYFHEYLLDEVIQDLMEKYDYSEDKATDLVYTGGLNIYSTVDSHAQAMIVKEFNKDSNFPSIAGYSTDGNGNIINSGGGIMLYSYRNFFNSKNEFKLKSQECKVNEDGSLTIKSGYRLNIYNTSAGYSLEFKPTYVNEGGKLYMYNGGYINIPEKYKSMDDNDNLVISAKFFKKYPDWIKLGKNTATITENAYTLPEKTIEPQASMVIVEVGTGKIKAMVGGRKQQGRQLYNRALNPRQSGSSIKPISVYSGALQKSYDLASEGKKFPFKDTGHDRQGSKYYGDYLTASSVIVDERMTFNGQTWPQNASNSFSGAVTMRKALQNSINVCAVKLELQVGAEYIADLVEKFGITTLDREGGTNDLNPAALALGGLTNGVIPLEMAQAYAAFPNGGVRQSSIAYTKVTDRNGKVLLTSKSESSKVLDEGVAFVMTDMLKSVVSQGIGSPAGISGVQAGGKTGTTSSEFDIWFDGFTPSYAAALWIGNDVNMQLTSMSGPAAALWGKIMNQIPKAKKGHYKSQPSDVTHVNGEYYTKGTESGRSTYFADRAREAAQRKAAAAKKKAASSKKSSHDDHDDDDDD